MSKLFNGFLFLSSLIFTVTLSLGDVLYAWDVIKRVVPSAILKIPVYPEIFGAWVFILTGLYILYVNDN